MDDSVEKIKFSKEAMKQLVGEFKIAVHMLSIWGAYEQEEYDEKLAYIKTWEAVLYEE